MRQSVVVLGSTGSVGANTLDVIGRNRSKFKVVALCCDSSYELLAKQCDLHKPLFAVVTLKVIAQKLSEMLKQLQCSTEVVFGEEPLCKIVRDASIDIVVAAIVGSAGLRPTLAAIQSGKKVLLANKESLVMAGPVMMAAAKFGGATILPIDSEHNAIFQCLPVDYSKTRHSGVRKLSLSASGGPFRGWTLNDMQDISPSQACEHPNWKMGKKVSVDSATLMNKGLEVIEASFLFGLPTDRIEVVLHPQSILHSAVHFADGSVLAQLGNPDMRVPIAHALGWPDRIESGAESLNMRLIGKLEFSEPDDETFPCLRLAYEASTIGGDAPTALNAANEVAVDAFLNLRISFIQISEVVEYLMNTYSFSELQSLEAVEGADLRARAISEARVRKIEI
ncbi:MAG: 1-deoxy-D-xylulose-5-phosphate reductoisomerase [Cellvibrionales bacterium TMED49]|nr:MAG: 1-deoxy-D-xylulose-5-phosphate reductoisomerase [Cellvibrionales bacterium TMED49]